MNTRRPAAAVIRGGRGGTSREPPYRIVRSSDGTARAEAGGSMRRGVLRVGTPASLVGVVLGLAALTALARLGPAEPRADLTVADGVSIVTLDPAQISWLQDIRVVTQLYEGLYALDPRGGGIVAAASERAEASADSGGGPTVYRFRLRPEARWSNGEPVSADDFVFSWRRAIEPGTGRHYGFFLECIRGVRPYVEWRRREIERLGRTPPAERSRRAAEHRSEADRRFAQEVGLIAENGRTLRVELDRPVAYFLDLLTLPVFLPVHRRSVERYVRTTNLGLVLEDPGWCKPENTYYNGAYVLESWRFKRGLRLRRNDHYRRAAETQIETVEWLDVADANTAWLMYATGRVDWLLSVDAPYAAGLVAESASPLAAAVNRNGDRRRDVHAVPAFGTYFYNLNCGARLADGRSNPLADPRVRRAICQAVDRAQIGREVTRRGERPAESLVPPGALRGYPAIAGLGYDPPAARQALADAGYPGGRGLPPIELLFNTEAEHGLIAQTVAAMLRRNLGVNISLVGKEAQTYREDKKARRFHLARASWYGDYDDPTSFLDVFRSDNGNNDSGYDDPAYDARLNAADLTADPDARLGALAECERRLMREGVPVLPLFHAVSVFAYDPEVVRGLVPGPRLLPSLSALEVRR